MITFGRFFTAYSVSKFEYRYDGSVDMGPLGYSAQTEIVPGIPGLTPPQYYHEILVLLLPLSDDVNKPMIIEKY